jgi:chemotaxis protein MotB
MARRIGGWQLGAVATWLAVLAGCNQGPYGNQAQVQKLQQDQLALADQNRRLLETQAALDRDNVETKKQLAQSQQYLKQREDELMAVRDQLRDAAQQLASLHSQKQTAEQQAESLMASARRGGGAIIRPNSSLKAALPQFNSPDISVRPDGDVFRIAIASDKLFQPGTAQLTSEGLQLVETVAAELVQRYPDQTIGVEGHIDADLSIAGAGTASMRAHQLSTAQAGAVLDQLVARGRLRANQLFVAGHGGNYPIYSNASPEGRSRNRRVELVIYPERVADRN